MIKVRTQLFVSLLFLLSSIALWNLVVPSRPAPPAPEPAAITAPATFPVQVEGVWEQYAVHGCHREFMARLQVRADGGSYVAHPLSLAENTFPKHSYRSYDHQFQNGQWTFKEDWDHGQVGEFTMELQPNGEYWGVARSNLDGTTFDTVYVRVSD
jgi:hypothetical protein